MKNKKNVIFNKMQSKIVLNCLLEPKFLDKNYEKHILTKLKETHNNSSITSGYIIEVNNILDIIHNNINVNNLLEIKLLCLVELLKLQVNTTIDDCNIVMIHNNGIFVNKYKIKILIPNNEENNFTYINNTCKYKDRILSCGDLIDIIIVDIRFEKNEYTCIGKFKD